MLSAVRRPCRRLEKTMTRIAPVVSSNIDPKVATTLSQVKASVGVSDGQGPFSEHMKITGLLVKIGGDATELS